MLNILEFIRSSYKQSAYEKFKICTSFTLFPWNFLKPPEDICYIQIYEVVPLNRSAYKNLK